VRLRSPRRPAAPANLAVGLLVGAAAVWSSGCGSHGSSGSAPSAAAKTTSVSITRPVQTTVDVVATPAGQLGAPIQDAAAATDPAGRVLLFGGLTASDTSTGSVVAVGRGGSRRIGALPFALHDAGAARIGAVAYVFGGGDGVRQRDEIIRFDPATGSNAVVGRLPAPSSDQAAAAIGGTAYVVGGYTGTRWLDTIVAWRPGTRARVVGRLPTPLRYAAVTAVGGRLVIAGGSRADGTASADVLEFAPSSGHVLRLGRLPAPLTHAAAAAIGGVAYVIGGRGATVGSARDAILAVDLRRRRIRVAGRLPEALSDEAAVATGGGILVVGGRAQSGTVATVTSVRQGIAPRAGGRAVRGAVPPLLDPRNVYAADSVDGLRGPARLAPSRIYVPNSQSDTVDEIDPATFKIVRHFAVGGLPQHVVPSYDLKTLYVTNDTGNSLTPIDPRTGSPGRAIPVDDPYNMYFTPDGRYAIVVAERLHRLDFRDAHTFRLHNSVHVGCSGIDHMDFSADGSYLLASCEFSSQLVKVDVQRERVVGTLALGAAAAPQDVKLSPDGRVFYVADMVRGGVWKVDGRRLRVLGFLATGRGSHGLYVSRDTKLLYVTNRAEGSVSLISFATGRTVGKWRIPGGGSPDMGNVSVDGRVLWLSGRWNGVVYALSTKDGRLLARIKVGQGPHGLSVWPQPGRYSLGHTGILR
jgi:DNA-binding beta-propeller fold protein YncE